MTTMLRRTGLQLSFRGVASGIHGMRYYIGLGLESLDAWGHGVLHCCFCFFAHGFKRTIQCSGFLVVSVSGSHPRLLSHNPLPRYAWNSWWPVPCDHHRPSAADSENSSVNPNHSARIRSPQTQETIRAAGWQATPHEEDYHDGWTALAVASGL